MTFPIEAGQTVYLNPVGNQARRSSNIKEVKIKSIGRKFFYVWDGKQENSSLAFHLDHFGQKYDFGSADWEVHQNMQSILDQRERAELLKYLTRDVFNSIHSSDLSLDQLRRIKSIAEEEVKDEI